jgi:hypothetical protein
LLEHEQILRTLDLSEINAAVSKKTARAMNSENFAKLKMLRSNIIPFTKCMRFFEGDDISVAFVVPVLTHLEWFLNTRLRSWIASTDEAYQHCFGLFISALNRRRKKHLDEDLLRAAYRLTSFGQIGFKDQGEDGTNSDLIDLQDPGTAPFHATRPSPIFKCCRRSWAQMKRQGIRRRVNPTMTMGIAKKRNRMKRRMNMLCPRGWNPIGEIQVIGDLNHAFCPS